MLTQTIGTSKNRLAVKILALALSLMLCFAMPFSADAAQTTKSIYTNSNYTQNSRFDSSTIVNGIDISTHNGTIDFKKLKATNTKVIIIRVGCRGYALKGTMMKDKDFDTNMKNALAQGFDVGVYFYSQALNEAEAREEANFALKYAKGYDFNLPIYYDYEFADVSSGRLDSAWRSGKLNKSKMTKNALAFCQTIENAGYGAGIYASKAFFEDNLDKSKLENDYSIWVAHYASKTTYAGLYQLWQYSARGKVSGISGYVDSNFVYYDLLKSGVDCSIPDQVYTGGEIKPEFECSYKGTPLVKNTDYTVSLENNINIGTAKANIIGINKYKDVIACSKPFKIIPTEVEGLRYDSRTTSSITVSWDENSLADKYCVQVHRSSGWVNAGDTKGTSLKISDLSSASNYKIRVCACKTVSSADYLGEYCEPVETATSPAVPTSLKAKNIKPNSLKLEWKKQSNASYYEVYKYNSETQKYELFSTVKGGKNNFLQVTDLAPNTKCKFKVRAYKKSKDGELLKSSKSSALTAYTAPSAPESSSAKSNAVKKISVKYKKTSSVTGYQVMWSTTKNFSSNYKSVYVSKQSTTLKTAQSKKNYYVKVRAYKTRNDKKIYSPWSTTLKVKTK